MANQQFEGALENSLEQGKTKNGHSYFVRLGISYYFFANNFF